MKQELTRAFADGATTLAVSAGASSYFGWFTFINDNAPAIGIMLSFFFGMAGLIFYWLTWKKATLADTNKIELLQQGEKLDQHIQETRDEFKKFDKGIILILNKLDKDE